MKRKWTAAVTLLLAVLLLAACGIAEEVKPDVTLIGAHVNSDDSSFNIGMVAFADKLKEISGGKMVMEEHSSENVQAVWAALGAQPTGVNRVLLIGAGDHHAVVHQNGRSDLEVGVLRIGAGGSLVGMA